VIDVTHTEAITEIHKRKKLTQLAVARMLQLNSRGSIVARIKNKGVRLCTLVELLDVLGYEMVVQPKTGETLPEGVYKIAVSDYEPTEEAT
jgi:hypothetical protein